MPRPLSSADPQQRDSFERQRLLLAYLRHLQQRGGDWNVAHILLSHLTPFNRRPHLLRLASGGFSRLAEDGRGQLFALDNGDLLFFFPSQQQACVDHEVLRLKRLFAEDPLILAGNDRRIARIYDVAADFAVIAALARVPTAFAVADAGAANGPGRGTAAPARQSTGKALPPALIAKLESAIARTNLASFVRRQIIYRLTGDRAEPVFTRFAVSLEDLAAALLPGFDLAARRPLARHVGEVAGRRLITQLLHPEGWNPDPCIDIQLTPATLLSDEFRVFDQHRFTALPRTIVIEMAVTDILDDLNRAVLACRLLRQRGYGLLIAGLTARLLPLIDCRTLAADYVACAFHPLMLPAADAGPARGTAIGSGERGQRVLTGVDVEDALRFGKANGFELFQGRYVDYAFRDQVHGQRLRSPLPHRR